MNSKKENEAIEELLSRGVEEVIDSENLKKKLKGKRPLRIKLGIDPTSPNIHLGRSIPLLKLRDFQKLGHQIILIIGDATGVIGDTSDKESERPMLSPEVIKKNLENYITQASKIIDIKKTEIYHNGDWLNKLTYAEIGPQADLFSINQFISRDNIQKRLKEGKRVSLRELLYPLMQGYDSVKVRADLELGGTDQRFNLLAGRDLQKHYGQEAQDILTGPLIEGLDGRKMSSSFGNTINLSDSPNEMFGKLMSLKDELIIKYFKLLTRIDLLEIKKYEKDLKAGTNPRDLKIILAHEIVSMYHSLEEAKKAKDYFIQTFSEKKLPDEVDEYKVRDYKLISVLLETKLASSKSEARRLIMQKGIKVDGNLIEDENFIIPKSSLLQKGKKGFLRII